jgi:hypothetical protein
VSFGQISVSNKSEPAVVPEPKSNSDGGGRLLTSLNELNASCLQLKNSQICLLEVACPDVCKSNGVHVRISVPFRANKFILNLVFLYENEAVS